VEQLKCDFPSCGNLATAHHVEVDGWGVVARNHCPEHSATDATDPAYWVGLGLIGLFGVGSLYVAIDRGQPGMPLAVLLFFIPLLVVMLWWGFPEAKVFEWPRRLAALRLLRHAAWAEVNRSAPALIIPLGAQVMPALQERFRKEFRGNEEIFSGLVSVLDRIDANWAVKEAGYIREQFLEEVKKPGDMYRRLLALLDRTDPSWTLELATPMREHLLEAMGKAGGLFLRYFDLMKRIDPDWISREMYVQNDALVSRLISTLEPHTTNREKPDVFDTSGLTVEYMLRWYVDVEVRPDLSDSERRECEELETRLQLLAQALRVCGRRIPETTLRRLAFFPDLGLVGTLGVYTDVSVDDRDREYRSRAAVDGVKRIISSEAVRTLAKQQLATSAK
jgi:hypothetical protein